MTIKEITNKIIPLHSLVIMCGPNFAGKSMLVRNKFENYEIICPEEIKYDIVGDKNRNDINHLSWTEVYKKISLKLSLGERVVLDSANLKKQNRVNIANIAARVGVPVFYIIVNRPLKDKITTSPKDKINIEKQEEFFLENEKDILRGDGIAEVIDTRIQDFKVVKKYGNDNLLKEIIGRGFTGLTAVGDVHGCLQAMRQCIMWAMGRRKLIVFLGDILDYGPNSLECIDEAYRLLTNGLSICLIGNHERKIDRWIEQAKQGQIKVKLSDGNKITIDAITKLSHLEREKFEMKFKTVMNLSRHHWVIGDAIFIHGAASPEMWDIKSSRLFGRLENIALFGEVDQEQFKDDCYPNKTYEWIDLIDKDKMVFVGHDIRQTHIPLVVTGAKGGQAIFMDTGSGKSGVLSSCDIKFDGNKPVIQLFLKN